MKYRIQHTTTYEYADKVSLSQNHARLTPQNNDRQQCLHHEVAITPDADYEDGFKDRFDNHVDVFEIPTLHTQMVVTSTSEVEVLPPPQHGLFEYQLSWEQVSQQLASPSDGYQLAAAQFRLPTPTTTATAPIRAYTLESFTPGRSMIESCEALMARIYNEFQFDPSFSTVNTPVDEIFEHKRGVCQDYAHFALACLRSIGLSARYVSGYIETLPPPGQEKLTGADATHAWFSLYVPGFGWLEFDPTNNLLPQQQHVTLASGRDFYDVSPLKGVMFGGGSHQLHVAVDMNRLD